MEEKQGKFKLNDTVAVFGGVIMLTILLILMIVFVIIQPLAESREKRMYYQQNLADHPIELALNKTITNKPYERNDSDMSHNTVTLSEHKIYSQDTCNYSPGYMDIGNWLVSSMIIDIHNHSSRDINIKEENIVVTAIDNKGNETVIKESVLCSPVSGNQMSKIISTGEKESLTGSYDVPRSTEKINISIQGFGYWNINMDDANIARPGKTGGEAVKPEEEQEETPTSSVNVPDTPTEIVVPDPDDLANNTANPTMDNVPDIEETLSPTVPLNPDSDDFRRNLNQWNPEPSEMIPGDNSMIIN